MHARRSDTPGHFIALSTAALRRAGLTSFPPPHPSVLRCPETDRPPASSADRSPSPASSVVSLGQYGSHWGGTVLLTNEDIGGKKAKDWESIGHTDLSKRDLIKLNIISTGQNQEGFLFLPYFIYLCRKVVEVNIWYKKFTVPFFQKKVRVNHM